MNLLDKLINFFQHLILSGLIVHGLVDHPEATSDHASCIVRHLHWAHAYTQSSHWPPPSDVGKHRSSTAERPSPKQNVWFNSFIFYIPEFWQKSKLNTKQNLTRWVLLNGITLGQIETDSNNRLILINEWSKHTLGVNW